MKAANLKERLVWACQRLNRALRSEGRMAGERQGGFALLNVLIAVLIMGTIAAVAVPKFNAAIAAANTAKIQADLAAIDTSIALYSIDKGTQPSQMSDLESYLENYDKLAPPEGKCNINGTAADVPDEGYGLSESTDGSMHACLGEYTIYDFGSKKKNQASGSGG